eukprot:1936270-Prymnesium_polylepis.3
MPRRGDRSDRAPPDEISRALVRWAGTHDGRHRRDVDVDVDDQATARVPPDAAAAREPEPHLPDLRPVGGLSTRLVVQAADAHHLDPRVVGQATLRHPNGERRVSGDRALREEVSDDEEAGERVRQRRVAACRAQLETPARVAIDEADTCDEVGLGEGRQYRGCVTWCVTKSGWAHGGGYAPESCGVAE